MIRLLHRCARQIICPLLVLIGGIATADPLHPLHGSATWRHEFSGWLFPAQVAGLMREGTPYQLDGGDDAGARYTAPGTTGITLLLEVLTRAQLDAPAGGSPFVLGTAPAVRGVRAVGARSDSDITIHYLFTLQDWTVRIVATAPLADAKATQALDDAVRALPWQSLGAEGRLHD